MNPKTVLRTLLDPILARPGAGTINFRGGFLSYQANAEDMPRLIGRAGFNLANLKTVVEKPGVRFTIIEPGHRAPGTAPAQFLGAHWDPLAVSPVIATALRWRGYDARSMSYLEGDRWKFSLMAIGIEPQFREALESWTQVCALSTGGKIFFDYDSHAIIS